MLSIYMTRSLPNSTGIEEFAPYDYIYVVGEVTTFQNNLQLNIKRVRIARPGEYRPEDYLPVSENDTATMYGELKENLEQKKDDVTRKMDEAEVILDEIRDDAKQQLDEVSETLSEKRGEASAYLLGKLKQFITETEEEN